MANLSKKYTLGKVINDLKMLTRKLGASSKILQPDYIAMINRNTLEIAALMSDAQDPYYQEKANVNSSASIYSTTLIVGTTYVDSTRVITKSTHGLDSDDVGRRIIIYWAEDLMLAPEGSLLAVSEIEEILTSSTFTIRHALGSNMSSFSYAVLPFSLQDSIDISALNVDTIIKLMDSVNGEIGLAGDAAIEYVAGLDESANSVFYNQVGHSLELKKGSNVAGYGTLTLHYYRIPNFVSALTDKIDLADKQIPTLINKCKLDIYDLLNIAPPQDLTSLVTNKVGALREAAATREKSKAIKQE